MAERNEHDRANEKPEVKPKTTEKPVGIESSTTAFAERVPEPVIPKTDKDRKAGQAKVATLQKEYDELLEQVRDEVDPAKKHQLVQRKGNVTRKIDAAKREAGL